MQIENLEQLLRRPTAYANCFREVEELNRGTFHRLHEAGVVDGSSDTVEDLLAELLLAGEERSDADLGGAYPASDFVLELLPLETLNISDAEFFDLEFAKARIDGGFSDAAVDLDALTEVAGGDHALGDAAEVVDGVGGDKIDLADAACGTVTAAVNGVNRRANRGSSAVTVETEKRSRDGVMVGVGFFFCCFFVGERVFWGRGGGKRV